MTKRTRRQLILKYIKKNEIIFIDKSYNISNTYLSQAEYFINNLKNNDPFMNNLDESFEILKIALYE